MSNHGICQAFTCKNKSTVQNTSSGTDAIRFSCSLVVLMFPDRNPETCECHVSTTMKNFLINMPCDAVLSPCSFQTCKSDDFPSVRERSTSNFLMDRKKEDGMNICPKKKKEDVICDQ